MTSLTVFDGLSVVEVVYGLDLSRVEACMPPQVPIPKPGPCPGAKRGVKKAADVIKDAVKKAAPKTGRTAQPRKATVKSTVAKKTAEPKAPKGAGAKKSTDAPVSAVDTVPAPTARPAGTGAYTGPTFTVTPEQQALIDQRARLKQELADLEAAERDGDSYDLDRAWKIGGEIDKIEQRMSEPLFERLQAEDMIARGIEFKRTNIEDDAVRKSPEQLRREMVEQLHREFDGKKVAIRTTPLALGKILDDGRFKTQHETGKGGAVAEYLPKRRREFEARTWGIPLTGFPNGRRPVHGYVAIHGIGPADDDFHLSQHGRVQVVLKDRVRTRTTAMIGDALDQQTQARPSPLTALEHWSYNPAYTPTDAPGDQAERNLNEKKFRSYGYADAQIHDGVEVDDIEEVVFPDEPSAQLQAKLDQKGVSWRVIPSQPDKDA